MLFRSREIPMNNAFSTLLLFSRSLFFAIFSLSAIVIYSVIVTITWLFLPLTARHKLIRSFLYTYIAALKYLCGIDYQVSGLENIPAANNGIVFSKHQSAWETFFLPLIFHDPAVILKRELLWIPFFGWGLAASDPIAINRNNKSSAMQQIITKGKKRLDEGRWVLVFPEGTRVPYGQVGHYRLGGARLAAATGYCVIPVAHNAGRYWPKRQFIKRPGIIQVVIGPAIDSRDKTPEQILSLAKQWIESTVVRIDGLIHKSSG